MIGMTRRELALLESELRRSLINRIERAKAAGVDRDTLASFARFVVTSGASIVTFNYDDILDEALWKFNPVTSGWSPDSRYWHPDGGYGFFCRPSSVCVADSSIFMDRPRSVLLKLHGSVNWRTRLGEGAPRGPAALLHHEVWMPRHTPHFGDPFEDHEIESHLEPEPFIVPPVLLKTGLTLHPVLRVVWAAAREKLSEATRVVFMGYSLLRIPAGVVLAYARPRS
jgi:hypothetical protein